MVVGRLRGLPYAECLQTIIPKIIIPFFLLLIEFYMFDTFESKDVFFMNVQYPMINIDLISVEILSTI